MFKRPMKSSWNVFLVILYYFRYGISGFSDIDFDFVTIFVVFVVAVAVAIAAATFTALSTTALF